MLKKEGKFLCKYTPALDYSNFYFENNKSALFYEKVVFETADFTKEERERAYKEAVIALDRKIKKRVLSLANIKRFITTISSFADIAWAVKRVYAITTKHDLRRVYQPRPKHVAK